MMPILYTVWPCDKPLPEELDYQIDYEVFIPHSAVQTKSSALSQDAMQLLEDEAISLALGTTPGARATTKIGVIRTLTGTVLLYDKFLKKSVPQASLKQRFQLGSSMWDTYTQANGYFSITAQIPNEATYYHVFQHPRWKITMEDATSPYISNWGLVGSRWSTSNNMSMTCTSAVPAYEINPAVDYYYHGTHAIGTAYYDSGIRIIAALRSGNGVWGLFSSSYFGQAYITIYKDTQNQNNYCIGTVFA